MRGQVAVQEVRRLQRFGVTAGELERYKMALLRDSAQAAEQALSVPSADNLDFIMESLALGHTVLDQRQVRNQNGLKREHCKACISSSCLNYSAGLHQQTARCRCSHTLCLQSHELLKDWAETITLEEVNAVAASYLSYISHYQAEQEILEQAANAQGSFAGVGPVRATAIVACIPAFTDPSGQSTGRLSTGKWFALLYCYTLRYYGRSDLLQAGGVLQMMLINVRMQVVVCR